MVTQYSHIYEETRQAIDQWLASVFSQLSASQTIAVFGAGPYARYLVQWLKTKGIKQVLFVVTVPRAASLDDTMIISLAELQEHQVDVILAGSLANPAGQQLALQQLGIKLPFYALEGGAFLCSEPRENPCNLAQLTALKGAHQGQTFFAIGNGPSLDQTPPEAIKTGILLGGNGILLRKNFIPDYYFLLDEEALEIWGSQIEALTCPKLIPSHLHFQYGLGPDRIYFPACFQYKNNNSIVDPYQLGIPSGGTIISTMLHFAVYMGAKRVVLIGVDNNYCGDHKQTHFTPNYCSDYYAKLYPRLEDKEAKRLALIHSSGILKAANLAKMNGINVVDATPVVNNLGLNKVKFADFIDT